MRVKLILIILMILGGLFTLLGAGAQAASSRGEERVLRIFHAGSLAIPFKDLSVKFNKLFPNLEVRRESDGSRKSARKVSELKKSADIVAVSDYAVIEELLMPEFAEWYIMFARNEMVIAYNERSKFASEISRDNWFEVLLRPGVEYGHSDPNIDPCGYRSLMVWRLAERYYQRPGLFKSLKEHRPRKNIRPKETGLIALIEAGELDYMFQYRSVAIQHHLKFIELPKKLNLSSIDHQDFYRQVELKISGKRPGDFTVVKGRPIIYGITIPKNAPNPRMAKAFIRMLISKEGQRIMSECGQPPIVPARASDVKRIPRGLRDLVQGSSRE